MSSKLTRTILLAGTVGFLIVWVLEFRRTTIFDSYWLLLLSITCLLFFQFNRLKSSLIAKKKAEEEELAKMSKKAGVSKTIKK
jgi:hypothetical protein